ncbi:MAG: hypothetical protein ACWA5P_01205 [bacterium]
MTKISEYIKKNFLVSISKTITVSLVTLILLPLIINRIGLDLFGIVGLTLLFSSVSSIVDLGLSKAVVLLTGEKKISENKVFSAAILINLSIIGILTLVFILLRFLGVNLLGSDINMTNSDQDILITVSFFLLILMLLNNLCRSILEAKLLMHIGNLSLTLYTPVLYLSIFVLSFFTKEVVWYIITPLVVTLAMFAFYVFYIFYKTKIQFSLVSIKELKYVFKSTLSFLNIGLINSMVTPIMRYAFILMVADTGLYAIFDLSFKIAMIANSFIVALSVPMLAIFANEQKNKAMVKVTWKIFYWSVIIFTTIILGYYLIGEYVLEFLQLEVQNLSLLYEITFVLILSLGFVGAVEIFYRFFLGNNQLKKAFLLKLIVPVVGIISFYLFEEFNLIYRFIYAYGVALFISALAIVLAFINEQKIQLAR